MVAHFIYAILTATPRYFCQYSRDEVRSDYVTDITRILPGVIDKRGRVAWIALGRFTRATLCAVPTAS